MQTKQFAPFRLSTKPKCENKKYLNYVFTEQILKLSTQVLPNGHFGLLKIFVAFVPHHIVVVNRFQPTCTVLPVQFAF